jgi:maleamate amidohydrolase
VPELQSAQRPPHGAAWERFLTERDRAVFARSGYGRVGGWGERPVVIVVDVTYDFCGDRPEPILDSIARWRNSCGAEAWEAVARIRALVDRAHERRVPVVYTTGMQYRPDGFDAGRWRDKNARFGEPADRDGPPGNAIVAALAPEPQDIVLPKAKPSAFFGTLLTAHLTSLRADSLIVCGTTTSGCVRATVVDGFSHNYRVTVVEDCTFDRGEASHALSIFDIGQKYADVVPVEAALAQLQALPDDLFLSELPALAACDGRAPVHSRSTSQ